MYFKIHQSLELMWICEYTHTFKTVGRFSFTDIFQNVSGSSFLSFKHLIWTFQQQFPALQETISSISVNFFDLSHIIVYGFAAVIIHIMITSVFAIIRTFYK